MKKILLIDGSDTYIWCLQKYLQHRGCPVKTACTLKEVRAADKKLPFILASCHDKDDYEQEAMASLLFIDCILLTLLCYS